MMLSIKKKYEPTANDNYLEDSSYRKILYKAFKYYNDEIQEILDLAVILDNGRRPLALENELYSSFHHISRSIFHCQNIKSAKNEINRAVDTHMKRVTLDVYKIILDKILQEIKSLHTLLNEIVIDEDVRGVLPNGVELAQQSEELRKNIRKNYIEAKYFERIGLHKKAVNKYKEAYSSACESVELIDFIQSDSQFKYIVRKLNKKNADRIEDRKYARKTALFAEITGALIASLLTCAITLCITKGNKQFPEKHPHYPDSTIVK